MTDEKPSNYHKRIYSKTGIVWGWDSTHPDLTPTSTFYVNGKSYCAYCCKQASPIQAGLRKPPPPGDIYQEWYYKTTGHTCCCEGAEVERACQRELEELKKKHAAEISKARSKLKKFDIPGALRVRFETDMKYAERGFSINKDFDQCFHRTI